MQNDSDCEKYYQHCRKILKGGQILLENPPSLTKTFKKNPDT